MAAGCAANGRKLSLEEADDPFERDLLWRPVEPVAAVRAAFGANDSGAAQRRHNLLEHRLGDGRPSCELLELHRRLRVC